jgi:hypothetical protein
MIIIIICFSRYLTHAAETASLCTERNTECRSAGALLNCEPLCNKRQSERGSEHANWTPGHELHLLAISFI